MTTVSGLDLLRTLYAYHTWATERLFTTAEGIAPEQWQARNVPAGMGGDSLAAVMTHLVSVERNWLLRVRALPLPPALEAVAFPSVSDLADHWREVNRETNDYLASLDDAVLPEVLSYVNSRGEHCAYPRWQMLLHQANHATQHRSEAAVLLTLLGRSPGDLDLLRYIDMPELS